MSKNQQLEKIASIEKDWARLRQLAGERQLDEAELRSLDALASQVAAATQFVTGDRTGFGGAVLPEFLDM